MNLDGYGFMLKSEVSIQGPMTWFENKRRKI
jgi:hypothetical protein